MWISNSPQAWKNLNNCVQNSEQPYTLIVFVGGGGGFEQKPMISGSQTSISF